MKMRSLAYESENMRKSDRACVLALLFFCLSIFFLSVVLFTFNPLTWAGALIIGVGLLFLLCCIVSFVRYGHFLKKAEENLSREASRKT